MKPVKEIDMTKEVKGNVWKRVLFSQVSGIIIVLFLLIVIFAIYSDYRFIRPANIRSLLGFGGEYSIVFLAVGILMISGEFDLSIGSILVFSSYMFVQFFQLGLNPFIAFLLSLGVGGALGFLNAIITVKGQIPSFVTTMGMMMFWRGFTLLLGGGATESIDLTPHPAFVSFFTSTLGGLIPIQIIWFVVSGIILGLLLHFHRFGNWIYATGDNRDAARAMGINTNYVKIICFIMVGVLCACAAGMQMARVSIFSSRAGEGWELRGVTAAVVGGTSLRGGVGLMGGIFLGAIIIMIIDNGLVAMRIPYSWSYVVFGLVILFSVLASLYIEKRRLSSR